MAHMIKRKQFDFAVPTQIEELINELDEAVQKNALYTDCIQDEIRSWAHGCTDRELTEEQAEEIIDYYCRRRWV